MTRGQRRFHAQLWLVLGPVLLVGLIALIASRPPANSPSSTTTAPPVSGRGGSP